MVKYLKQLFEEKVGPKRLPRLVMVIASLVVAVIMFYVTKEDIFDLFGHLNQRAAPGLTADMHTRLELEIGVGAIKVLLDIYLIAVTVLIFAPNLYKFFVSRNQIGMAEDFAFASWLFLARSVDDLKQRLISVVLLWLLIGFFQRALRLGHDSAFALVGLGVVILLIGSAMYWSYRREVTRQ